MKQRYCTTCYREKHNAAKRAKITRCPNGHEFDGVRHKADGTVRQRFCTICVGKQLAEGRKTKAANRTHCLHGHPLDGVNRRPDGTVKQRYCKTCNRERKRLQKAAGPTD